MKFFRTIISSFKRTKLLILIFFTLSIMLNYLTTYIPIVIQYFIDIILKQSTKTNGILDMVVNLYEKRLDLQQLYV